MMEMKKWRKVGGFLSDQPPSRSLVLLLWFAAAFAVRTAGWNLTELDLGVMMEVKGNLTFPNITSAWAGPDPCDWSGVSCVAMPNEDDLLAVFVVDISDMNISGRLPGSLGNLSQLSQFHASRNSLTGPLPDFAGSSQSLFNLSLDSNRFTSIPRALFRNKPYLINVNLDYNPLLEPWEIPEDLTFSQNLMNFSAADCNIHGDFPSFFNDGNFAFLFHLHLANNHLSGHLPPTLPQFLITLWLSNQTRTDGSSSLSGGISAIQSLTWVTQLYLHNNNFSGQIPDMSRLRRLTEFVVSYNSLTGPVPESLARIPSLTDVFLSNNYLNGSVPQFKQINVTVSTCGNPGLADNKGLPCFD